MDHRPAFDLEKSRFDTCVEFAISVSKLAAGRTQNLPRLMASYVFTRACVCADTIRYALRREIEKSKDVTLDHYSISVLARNLIEASLMFHYLMEDGVSDDEWSLRGKLFYLHDATLKLRLFKTINAAESYKAFKQDVTELRETIRKSRAFAKLDAKHQERILSGQELYIGGLRSTVKLAGLSAKYFDGMYARLSAEVHISPTSFFETDKRLSFATPADYQYYMAALALAHARRLLMGATIRLAESDPIVSDKIEAKSLQLMRELEMAPPLRTQAMRRKGIEPLPRTES
ncbi:MAG TPA: DUF5677 domain-containing protein [Bradyrhizobium sp.]|nr:DUF5677 domain-containing protein [Bradyrhizobium sp.]